jgi:SAM-dependent methyltransferase
LARPRISTFIGRCGFKTETNKQRFFEENASMASMPLVEKKFREFWGDKTAPLSRSVKPTFLRLVAGELTLLFDGRNPESVLEIGCGNGCLFDYLGFSPRAYRGVDFGPRLLEGFRHQHPELDLVEADGSAYMDERTYDLILAHDVIAYFTPAMLARHCQNARRMMHAESLLVWSCLPWRALRKTFDLGIWFEGGRPSVVRRTKSQIKRLLGRDLNGRWYNTSEIAKIARENSMDVRFHGSVSHPYRFHAVLSLKDTKTNTRSIS